MPEGFEFPTTQEGCKERMEEINKHVKDVSQIRFFKICRVQQLSLLSS